MVAAAGVDHLVVVAAEAAVAVTVAAVEAEDSAAEGKLF